MFYCTIEDICIGIFQYLQLLWTIIWTSVPGKEDYEEGIDL